MFIVLNYLTNFFIVKMANYHYAIFLVANKASLLD
jgi:hypothetical protein